MVDKFDEIRKEVLRNSNSLLASSRLAKLDLEPRLHPKDAADIIPFLVEYIRFQQSGAWRIITQVEKVILGAGSDSDESENSTDSHVRRKSPRMGVVHPNGKDAAANLETALQSISQQLTEKLVERLEQKAYLRKTFRDATALVGPGKTYGKRRAVIRFSEVVLTNKKAVLDAQTQALERLGIARMVEVVPASEEPVSSELCLAEDNPVSLDENRELDRDSSNSGLNDEAANNFSLLKNTDGDKNRMDACANLTDREKRLQFAADAVESVARWQQRKRTQRLAPPSETSNFHSLRVYSDKTVTATKIYLQSSSGVPNIQRARGAIGDPPACLVPADIASSRFKFTSDVPEREKVIRAPNLQQRLKDLRLQYCGRNREQFSREMVDNIVDPVGMGIDVNDFKRPARGQPTARSFIRERRKLVETNKDLRESSDKAIHDASSATNSLSSTVERFKETQELQAKAAAFELQDKRMFQENSLRDRWEDALEHTDVLPVLLVPRVHFVEKEPPRIFLTQTTEMGRRQPPDQNVDILRMIDDAETPSKATNIDAANIRCQKKREAREMENLQSHDWLLPVISRLRDLHRRNAGCEPRSLFILVASLAQLLKLGYKLSKALLFQLIEYSVPGDDHRQDAVYLTMSMIFQHYKIGTGEYIRWANEKKVVPANILVARMKRHYLRRNKWKLEIEKRERSVRIASQFLDMLQHRDGGKLEEEGIDPGELDATTSQVELEPQGKRMSARSPSIPFSWKGLHASSPFKQRQPSSISTGADSFIRRNRTLTFRSTRVNSSLLSPDAVDSLAAGETFSDCDSDVEELIRDFSLVR